MKDHHFEKFTSLILLILNIVFDLYITFVLLKTELLYSVIFNYCTKILVTNLFAIYCFNIWNGIDLTPKSTAIKIVFYPIRMCLSEQLKICRKM